MTYIYNFPLTSDIERSANGGAAPSGRLCKFGDGLKSSEKKTNEPRHEKTCVSHVQTTKVQISLRIRAVWSAPLLFTA